MASLRKSEEDIVRLHSGDDLSTYIDTLAGHGPQHEAVIEIERDDDLTSLRSKLESIRVPRAVLVLSANVKILREGLEYRVLRRLQRELGLDLVIVSNDLNRRTLAHENGFRNVFATLRAYYRSKGTAPEGSVEAPFTEPQEFTPALSVGRWGFAVAAVLALVFAVVAYFAVPVASVVIYPETQTMVRDVEVLVEIGGPRLDLISQRLSGRVVEERVQVEGTIGVRDVAAPPGTPPGNNTPAAGFQPGTNITLEVRDTLRDRLLRQASTEATELLKAQLRSNESVPEATIRTEITGERYDHNIGDVADTLGGALEIVTTALVFNNDDFNKLVFALWSQDIPRNWKALGDPNLTAPAVVSAEGQHMTLRVRATGRLQHEVDTEAVTNAVRGRTTPEARQQLARIEGLARPPEITLWPDWARWAYRVQAKTVLERDR